MSQPCPRQEEILAPPALRHSSPASLRDHLETCASCQAAAEALVGIRAELAEHDPAPRPGVEARLLAEIQAATAGDRRDGKHLRRGIGLTLGLALATAGLFLLLSPTRPHAAVVSDGELAQAARPGAPHLLVNDAVPLATPLSTRAPTRVATLISRLRLDQGTHFELHTGSGKIAVVETVQLTSGRVHAEVTPLRGGRSFTVRTEEALVTVVGTAFLVQRDPEAGRTVIEVQHGVVRAESRDGTRVLELRAGDRAVFPQPPAPENLREAPPDDPAGDESAGDEPAGVNPDALAELATRARTRRRGSRQTRRSKRTPPEQALTALETPPIPDRSTLSLPPTLVAAEDRPGLQRRQLAQARRALRAAPAEAIDLARGILDHASTESIEAEALAVLADGYRRSGRLEDAANTYARVAHHPAGEALAEESLLQLALLRRRQALHPAALSALEEAGRRFPAGMLAPERISLTVEILLRTGRREQAVTLLLASESLHSPEVERQRIRQAEGLSALRPDQARALLSATRIESLSASWDARHEALTRALP